MGNIIGFAIVIGVLLIAASIGGFLLLIGLNLMGVAVPFTWQTILGAVLVTAALRGGGGGSD